MLDQMAIAAAFSQPDPDGAFRGAFADYLRELGRRRPAILFAFPPKAAGTFLRTAAIEAVGGQLVRIVHAQGGRDAQPYLPRLIDYYAGNVCTGPLVAHMHMQALPGNCGIIDAFGLKPIVMVRAIPDMLASFWDMLEADETARFEGLNCPVPPDFPSLPAARKADFCIDMLAPWYVGFYASWFANRAAQPDRVCLLRYREIKTDPAAALARALSHAGVPRSLNACRTALDLTWAERHEHRFNKGEEGRGRDYFIPSHLARLESMLDFHPILSSLHDELLGRAA